jgi:hypothetical protein
LNPATKMPDPRNSGPAARRCGKLPSGARQVDGKKFPDDRFGAVFFQPFYAGQTFGLGQLNPLTALVHSDRVSKVSRYRKLSAGNAARVYEAIMEPDSTLAFMAASIANRSRTTAILPDSISQRIRADSDALQCRQFGQTRRDNWPKPTGNAQTAVRGGCCRRKTIMAGWSIITRTSCGN